ncbi:MAG TPA: copper transporter [Gaiellaceae bacterium]|nr:copper transporter [Gaiellaceae bacterium]
MFDLRYHVASLTAVFLALVIGILVGVGISDRGLVDKTTTGLLRDRIDALQTRLDQVSQQTAASKREQRAAERFIAETYPTLVHNRLRGKRFAVLFVGKVNGDIRSTIEQTLTDAGAKMLRLRALKVPVDVPTLEAKLATQPASAAYAGSSKLDQLGGALGTELVSGGATPLWDSLTDTLVEHYVGSGKQPVDGVIVVRTVPPQKDGTSRMLFGLYHGLSSLGVPAVGVETTKTAKSAVPVYQKAGLSSIDDVDKQAGQLGLVLLLAGGSPGQYGLRASADDALPSIPVPTSTGG